MTITFCIYKLYVVFIIKTKIHGTFIELRYAFITNKKCITQIITYVFGKCIKFLKKGNKKNATETWLPEGDWII